MKKLSAYLGVLILALCFIPPAMAKGGADVKTVSNATGGGGGGKSKVSPDYGDLYRLFRDLNGVPILSDIGCLQPLNIFGGLVPLDEYCEVVEGDGILPPEEVDFGRLSVARSPESVLEASFDEVISLIKSSSFVDIDPAGRLMLETEIFDQETGEVETAWKTIDSPLENLALYVHLMKYGHVQTATGVIADEEGDVITYRPALDPDADYGKFGTNVRFLLPMIPGGVEAEKPTVKDLTFSAFFLAGAADKTGEITVDLVQYINRILAIPNLTNSITENPDFVDFRHMAYCRDDNFDKEVAVILPANIAGTWYVTDVNLLDWLDVANNDQSASYNIAAFVKAAKGALSVILFIHNYEIPADLWDIQIFAP